MLPLVLLGGTLCDRRVFAPLIERLPGQEVIVPAMWGEHSSAALARRLLADLPPVFALAGFSMGGMVALDMIAQAPRRVAKLALIASNARPLPDTGIALRREALERARERGIGVYVEDGWDRFVSQANRADEAIRGTIAAMARDLGLAVHAQQTEIVVGRADSRPRLKDIGVPVLVLGGMEDALCPPDMQHEMAILIADAKLVLVEGAGHFALLEAPDAVADAIGEWLAVRAAHRPPEAARISVEETR